jgi:CHAD domain-containing protein
MIHDTAGRIAHPARVRSRDVHQVRVCVKFLRAILRLLHPVIGGDLFRREDKRLQAAAARLSFQRDITVARRTLEKLAARPGSTLEQKSAFTLAMHGLDSGMARREHSLHALEEAMQQAERDLQHTAGILRSLRFQADAAHGIEEGLLKSYRTGRRRMRKAINSGCDADFHAWRKSAKYLFFQIGILQPVWPRRLAKMVEQLDHLQKDAGNDHDIVVLKTLLGLGPLDKFGGQLPLSVVFDALERRSNKLRKRAEALGKKIYREKSGAFIAGIRRHWKNWR